MALDKFNKTILKLAAVACAPVKLGQDLTVEECVVQVVCEPSRFPEGHAKIRVLEKIRGKTNFSTTEIETAISDLLQASVLSQWTPLADASGEQQIRYQPTLEFVSLMSTYTGERGKHLLFSTDIQVKGNKVALQDLYQFYKNVLWLFETQKDLEHIYVGVSKLTKKEAMDLYTILKQQKAFE
ncbi:hypothetical protein [Ralstonia phage RSF1]|uniref:Uncharacterized protein n=1 Tax=Ralstonia phage RSF1 TaxID=1689679 RepID=A0A0K2QQU7_9CAUD|nr:hypothetical protein AVU11_gp131 [Ralstonia phage RSF1]BAS04923.1 hypothetical protein [Ralstonia phage RSF1]